MEKSSSNIDTQLLDIVHRFLAEVKPERTWNAISLDASLERDLGIDSLGRVELFLRIEKQFSVTLPESLMATAEHLRDIALCLYNAKPSHKKVSQDFVASLPRSHFDPSSARTLVDVLLKYALTDPNRPHIYLQNEQGEEQIIRYGQLLAEAQKTACGLYALGLKPFETVAIMLPTSEDFFYAFFGVLLAGGVPVPIYPPVRPDKIEEYAVREAGILNNAEVKILITFSQVETLGKLLKIFIKSLQAVTTVPLLKKTSNTHLPNLSIQTEDAAMIQYTSGSTSAPKGVLLSHYNLLANIRAVEIGAQISPTDVGVSWLPLYHDMGLIGAWFSSLYHGFPLTLMSPLMFLSRPERWLWAIHYHRATLSAGPNFAYELCTRKIREEDIQGLDLSSWRLAFNGAEAINPRTLERFIKKFEPYGFKAESFYPVYGLAECAVALTFPPLGRAPKVDVILREVFEKEQRAVSVGSDVEKHKPSILEFVACGKPLAEHDIRIVDTEGNEVGERIVGSLQFCGPSAMQGYYRNPEATQAVYQDGWWDSGDFAYLASGEVYITGRKKDIIIKAGRNLYPQEIEEVASQITGVRKGCVVAFGIEDPRWGTEMLVLIAETTETNKQVRAKIIADIIEKISVVLGLPPDQVVLVPPRTIPKTSSGKLQRSACKQAFQAGRLVKVGLPVWLQIIRLWSKGLGLSVVNILRTVLRFFYTLYVAMLVILLGLPVFICVVLLPLKWALRTVKIFCQIMVRLLGYPLKVEGVEYLKNKERGSEDPLVYVCNHASYVDPLLLLAVLSPQVHIVGKSEVLKWPLLGSILKKLGYPTVDRWDVSKSLEATTSIMNSLNQGYSVIFFPEGTFTYATGLRPFKLGAFKVAVDAEVPLCPIAIQGTRQFLRGNQWLLNPSHFKVNISKPIVPQSKEWSEVTRLHALARAEIAKGCGELMIDLVEVGVKRV